MYFCHSLKFIYITYNTAQKLQSELPNKKISELKYYSNLIIHQELKP